MKPTQRERRFRLRTPVTKVLRTLRAPLDVTILDLSTEGLGLETSSWLSVGRTYRVRLTGEKQEFSLSGTVAWCALSMTSRGAGGEKAPVYRAGLRFTHQLADHASQFEAFAKAVKATGRETAKKADAAAVPVRFLANERSGVFHLGECRHAGRCTRQLTSREEALAAGFRPGSCCGS